MHFSIHLCSTYSHNSADSGTVNDHAGVIYAWQKCVIENYGSVYEGNYARGMGGVMFVEEDTTVVNYQVFTLLSKEVSLYPLPIQYPHTIANKALSALKVHNESWRFAYIKVVHCIYGSKSP